MTLDTAQASPADPNAQLQNAADAFKAFTTEGPIEQPRNDRGQFAPAEQPETVIEADEPEGEIAESEADTDEPEDAADEAQQDAVPPPASWSKEDAELWAALPAEAQAKIAEREAQRDSAVNQKFQAIANERKALEANLTEANANRDAYRDAIDTVLSLVQPVKPDPREYGAGTGNYNREAYDLAVLEYQQATETVQALRQQRETIAAQQAQEAEKAMQRELQAIEEVARPRFLADVPDLAQPEKGAAVLNEIVRYAVESGIPEHIFQGENASAVTSAELHLAWKAMQYDRIKAAQGQVRAAPPPKPAQPAVKPGSTIPRSATRQAAYRKATERLASEGSVEAGAAVWKNFL